MTALAKVFVIIVFLLSVVQTSIYSTIFYHRTNWKENFKRMSKDYIKLARHKDNLIAVREQRVRTLQQTISDDKREVSSFRANLANESRINIMLKSSLAQQIQEHEILLDSNAKTVTQIEKLNEMIKSRTDEVTRLKEKHTEATAREDLVQRQLGRLVGIKTDLEKDLIEIKKEYLTARKAQEGLQLRIDRLRELGYPVDEVLVNELAPSIKAEVVAVIKNIEPNLVLISVGQNSKVKKGYRFTIFRGNEFVARVVVEKVLPRFSGCRVLFKRKDIETTDSAKTHIE